MRESESYPAAAADSAALPPTAVAFVCLSEKWNKNLIRFLFDSYSKNNRINEKKITAPNANIAEITEESVTPHAKLIYAISEIAIRILDMG